MVGLIVKALVGVVLFVGSLLGGLAATGRLNHDGTANIPVLNSFFPAPPPPAEGEKGKDGKDKDGKAADGKAEPADGAHAKDEAAGPQDAHATPAGETGKAAPAEAAGGTKDEHGADPQEPKGTVEKRVGKSVVNPEKPAEAGGHGGGHGEPAAGGHGEPKGHGEAKGAHGDTKAAHGAEPAGHGDPHAAPHGETGHGSPEGDFNQLGTSLAKGNNQYRPGALFRFDAMPANLTPEMINDAWQRVQGLMAEVDRRRTSLEQREKELQDLQNDVSRRQADLGALQAKLDEMQRAIDAKIQKFQDQVKLVRNDEVAALKRNAASMASFEPARAAEIVQDSWKTEKGQDEVLRLMEFMDKDAVNEILKTLPLPLAQDVMNKRLRVSKEPPAAGKAK